MASDTGLSDDYVAQLLKNDAKAHALRFSALGFQNHFPSRPSTKAPKPNTRFLRNIIRETDHHNAALLSREAQQSRSKLRDIERSKRKRGPSRSRDGSRERPAQASDEDSHGKRSRHRRRHDSHHHRRHRRRDDESYNSGRRREPDDHLEGDSRHETRGKKKGSSEDSNGHEHYRRHSYDGGSHKLPRHRSPTQDGDLLGDHKRRHRRKRSVSHERSPPLDGDIDAPSRRHRQKRDHRLTERRCLPRTSHLHDDKKEPSPSKAQEQPPSLQHSSSEDSSDTDPLDAVIGPSLPAKPSAAAAAAAGGREPKPHHRGRGAIASSAMDAHFAATYDPATDVQPTAAEADDDWDQALEALRDRQLWKQQGAERLRSAGFTQEEVDKWERGGGERREEDVRWGKRGESREWDRGKVVNANGEVDTRPEWCKVEDG